MILKLYFLVQLFDDSALRHDTARHNLVFVNDRVQLVCVLFGIILKNISLLLHPENQLELKICREKCNFIFHLRHNLLLCNIYQIFVEPITTQYRILTH